MSDDDALDPTRVLGAISQPERLRVVAALVLGASTRDEVRRATGLSAREALRELRRLVATGLVEEGAGSPEGYRLRDDVLIRSARVAAERLGPAEVPAETAQERVRRTFLQNGRLVSIPASRSKRLIVLDVLAQEFEPGRRYPEREVNRRLRAYHPDVAALRRYLVDDGFMQRDHGEYWRAGGTFDPNA